MTILGFVVFEFDVQTIFDANLHLDGVVAVGRHAERMYPDIPLLRYVRHSPRNRDTDEVPVDVSTNLFLYRPKFYDT